MPSVSISPILNAQVVTDAGAPASGWKIYSYIAGSTTPLPVYTDATGSVAQTNPIILNASGFPTQGQLWLQDAQFYKLVLTDQNDVLRRTFDQISGVNDPSLVSAEQWQDIGTVASFVSANSFALAGDQVGEYHVGRRVQLKQGVGFVYGYITASTYASGPQTTTVTVQLDNAATLTNALTQSNLSLLRADHHALPKIDYELNSLQVGTVNATTINMSGAINEAPQVTLPSAATVDIGAAASNSILITGTTTINSFGVAAAGILRTVEFQSSLTLTYNATSMQLPSLANIVTQPGDTLFAYSKGGGNWKVISYTLASGSSLVPSGFTRVQVFATPGSFNFTVPAGVTRVKVTVTGGGGVASFRPDESAQGGMAGGTALKWISGLTPGQTIPLVVGLGQTSDPPFLPATSSSFGAFCTGTAATAGLFPTPGIGSGGDINVTGSVGDIGPNDVPNGGASYWGSNKSFGAGGCHNGVPTDRFGRNGVVVVEY
jgi:hypothetical protein